jgi:hypothetical protein
MQSADQLANDRSGCMGVGLKCGERDGGNDGEKDLSAQPHNEGQREQRAKKGLHC